MRHGSRNRNGLVLLMLYFFIHSEFDCVLDLALLLRNVISGWTTDGGNEKLLMHPYAGKFDT